VKFFLVFLFLSFKVAIAQEFVLGEGKFYSEAEDENLIKNELLYEAYKDVYYKEISRLGLNLEIFKKRLNENITQNVQKKFPTAKDKNSTEYKNHWSQEEKSILDLSKIIPTYSIKNITRSTHEPNLRYIHIEAQTNLDEIRKIYLQILGDQKQNSISTLFLMIKFDLDGISPETLGVNNIKELKEALEKTWLEFIEKNKPTTITQVKVLESTDSKFEKWEGLSDIELNSNIPEQFRDASLLLLNFKIKPVSLNEKFNDYILNFSGNYLIKDMSSKSIMAHGLLDSNSKMFHFEDSKSKSSTIASYIYRIPLNIFLNLKSEMKVKLGVTPNAHELQIFGYKNVQDLALFVDWLKTRGAKYNLQSSIKSFGKESGELKVVLEGGAQEIKDLLKLMKQEKRNFIPELIDSDRLLSVKLSYPEIIQGATPGSKENGSL
jgi:hypothetical protein